MILWLLLSTVALVAAQEPPQYGYENLPETRFTCEGKLQGRYYADPETDCQMFHVCVRMSRNEVQDYRFLCPNGTVFDQEHLVCADFYQVACHANIHGGPFGHIFEFLKLSASKDAALNLGTVPITDPDYLGRNTLGGDDFQVEEYNNNKLAAQGNSLYNSQGLRQKEIQFPTTTTRRTTTPRPTTTRFTTTAAPVTTTTTTTTEAPYYNAYSTDAPLDEAYPSTTNYQNNLNFHRETDVPQTFPTTTRRPDYFPGSNFGFNNDYSSSYTSTTYAPPTTTTLANYYQSSEQTTRRPAFFQSTFRTTLDAITTPAPYQSQNQQQQTFQQQPTRFGDDYFRKIPTTEQSTTAKAQFLFYGETVDTSATTTVSPRGQQSFRGNSYYSTTTAPSTQYFGNTASTTTTASPFQSFGNNNAYTTAAPYQGFGNNNAYTTAAPAQSFGNDNAYTTAAPAQSYDSGAYTTTTLAPSQYFGSNNAYTTTTQRLAFSTSAPRQSNFRNNAYTTTTPKLAFSTSAPRQSTFGSNAYTTTTPKLAFSTSAPRQSNLGSNAYTTVAPENSYLQSGRSINAGPFQKTDKPKQFATKATPAPDYFAQSTPGSVDSYSNPSQAAYSTPQLYEEQRFTETAAPTTSTSTTTETPRPVRRGGRRRLNPNRQRANNNGQYNGEGRQGGQYNAEQEAQTGQYTAEGRQGTQYTGEGRQNSRYSGARRQNVNPDFQYTRRTQNTQEAYAVRQRTDEVFNAEASVFRGSQQNSFYSDETKSSSQAPEVTAAPTRSADSYFGGDFGRRVRPGNNKAYQTIERKPTTTTTAEPFIDGDSQPAYSAAPVAPQEPQRKVVKRIRPKSTTPAPLPITLPPFSPSTPKPTVRPSVRTKTVYGPISPDNNGNFNGRRVIVKKVRPSSTAEPAIQTPAPFGDYNQNTEAPSFKVEELPPQQFGSNPAAPQGKNLTATVGGFKVTVISKSSDQQTSTSFVEEQTTPSYVKPSFPKLNKSFLTKKPLSSTSVSTTTTSSPFSSGDEIGSTKSPDYDYQYFSTDDESQYVAEQNSQDRLYGGKARRAPGSVAVF